MKKQNIFYKKHLAKVEILLDKVSLDKYFQRKDPSVDVWSINEKDKRLREFLNRFNQQKEKLNTNIIIEKKKNKKNKKNKIESYPDPTHKNEEYENILDISLGNLNFKNNMISTDNDQEYHIMNNDNYNDNILNSVNGNNIQSKVGRRKQKIFNDEEKDTYNNISRTNLNFELVGLMKTNNAKFNENKTKYNYFDNSFFTNAPEKKSKLFNVKKKQK